MRAFIAVDLPADLRVDLGRWQEKLRKSARGARWVRPEGIHLTLKFLGEISSAQVIEVSKILSTLPRIAPFEIHFKGFGFFPHAGRPRVLWVGIEPCPTLEALAAQVDKSIRWAENLSKRLRAIAEDLDRVLQGGELFLTPINAAMAFEIKDPVSASVGASVTWNYQHVLKSKTPENIRDTPGQIRAFADYLEGARSLQKFVSHRSLRSMALLSLIELVKTRKNKPNLAILERLLNAVFDAIGQESQYTASWLNTFYGRNNLSAKLESAKKRLARRRS